MRPRDRWNGRIPNGSDHRLRASVFYGVLVSEPVLIRLPLNGNGEIPKIATPGIILLLLGPLLLGAPSETLR